MALLFLALLTATSAEEEILSPSLLRPLVHPSVYDKLASPGRAFGEGKTTHALVDMYIADISAIDAGKMDFTVDMFLRLSWHDPRLAYNGTPSGGYINTQDQEIYNSIWWPDLYFDNSKAATFQFMTTPNMLLRVYPNGSIFTSRRCFMNLHYYPSDIQDCPIKIMTYMTTIDQVELAWQKGNETIVYVQSRDLPDFKVLRPALVQNCDGVYSSGTWSCLLCVFRFRRYIGYHMFQMFLPSTAVVSISWISFVGKYKYWISPRAVPARATLSITTFLALSTQASGIRVTLPAVSYATAVDVWSSICTVFVYGSLLEFALAYHLFESEEAAAMKRRALSAWEGKAKVHDLEPEEKVEIRRRWYHRFVSCGWFNSTQVDRLSRWLFPLSFVVCNLAFWTYYEFLPNATSANLDCEDVDAACITRVRTGYGLA